MRISRLGVILLTTACSTVWADLPLNIEGIIADQGQLKLDLSLAYANANRSGVSTGEPITVQTGIASFITLPTLIGESRTNSDSLVGTLGLRYGVSTKAEIFTRASWLYNSSRNIDVSGSSSQSSGRFADAWAGINYQFKGDDATPAWLGFTEIALHENHIYSNSSLKSVLLGLTTYKAIDPVVFSLTGAYRLNQNRKDGAHDYKPGNFLLLSPSVAFAANDRVTLITAMQWTNRQADQWDGKLQGFRRSNSDLLLGAGYGINKG